ncbi:hypothetical protein N0V90_002164 [Kalmusia sp. IMI 367209]|nr:hypothetical protein N0V90_002164 [Kalmusia sp. IMI 367209]
MMPLPPPPPPLTLEGSLMSENSKGVKKEGAKGEKADFWGALMASARRRKSVAPPSPLCSVVEDAVETELTKDRDGDVEMAMADPALVSQATSSSTVAAAVQTSTPVVKVKEIIRKTTKRAIKVPNLVHVTEKSGSDNYDSERVNYGGLYEFPALERVGSRDSGYHSTPESAKAW